MNFRQLVSAHAAQNYDLIEADAARFGPPPPAELLRSMEEVSDADCNLDAMLAEIERTEELVRQALHAEGGGTVVIDFDE